MIGLLIGVAVAAFLLALLMAPLETLGWWAGWYGEESESETRPPASTRAPYRTFGPTGQRFRRHYVVFLDGIAKVGDVNYDEVQALLDQLSRRLPTATVLGDVMPYSVTNRSLLTNRPMAGFWRFAFRLKVQGKAPLINFMINIRNMFQVLVAADSRYGPMFGQGEAGVILNSLTAQGYVPDDSTPVTLIGYSGGSQVALVASPYLRLSVRGPLNVISLAGLNANEVGLEVIDHLWHLQGSRDSVPGIADLVFPGRWSIFRNSYWNRLRRSGRFTKVDLPAITHSGHGSYLDDSVELDGSTPQAITVDALVGILRDIQPQQPVQH